MRILADLRHRRLQAEIMDQPDLDRQRHFQALRGLERINFWSGSVRIIWSALCILARERQGQPLRILDVASGAGDVAIGLWRQGRRTGFPLSIDGWDISSASVEYAQERAQERSAAVRFYRMDALGEVPIEGYDVVISSLFLHHLTEERAIELLRRMAEGARRGVLVNDLDRSRSGLILARLGTRLLSASDVVHTDGPRSVEGAFTVNEVRELADRAEMREATVCRRWPCRWLLTWKR
jgi:2-polyprenyl-3-methyl-5-hydroxy-6-metoxy-1,4-benzoquinol methylase